MKKIAVLVFSLFVCSEQVCFPDEEIRDCLERKNKRAERPSLVSTNEDEDRVEISERSSLISGRYCFSTRGGYTGQCEFRGSCPRRYSRSKTCGGNHVCCKANTRAERRPTRPPGGGRSTTRLPPVRRTEGETCGVVLSDLIYCRGRNCTAGRQGSILPHCAVQPVCQSVRLLVNVLV